jgi:hypothetical protein
MSARARCSAPFTDATDESSSVAASLADRPSTIAEEQHGSLSWWKELDCGD